MNSVEEFSANIAHTVELVSRGDVAAFVIPGQTALDTEGAHRFGMAYSALAAAATERARTVVLRWHFDELDSHYAKLNTVSNAENLLAERRHTSQTIQYVYSSYTGLESFMRTMGHCSRSHSVSGGRSHWAYRP